MQSPAGRLLNHVADLDSMLQCPGFAITANDLDMLEWGALRVLWSERSKYEVEMQKQREQEAKMQAASGRR